MTSPDRTLRSRASGVATVSGLIQASTIVAHDGDVWRVLQVGHIERGAAICQLASTSRGRHQGTVKVPLRLTSQIPVSQLEVAFDRPVGFFAWYAPLRAAFDKGDAEARAGGREDRCPYPLNPKLRRTAKPSVYETAWRDGYRWGRMRTAVMRVFSGGG